MQFPESWLRAFCNPPLSTQGLADLLTMSGMEVEEMRPVAPPFTQVVVGEVLSTERHPNADRLNVCQVHVGAQAPLTIVCGAPNVRPGIKVPTALVGATLPPGEDGKPFVIGKGKLRGVESFGMLCSARELQLSDEHGGLLELSGDAVPGQNVREHLQLDDTLFTLKLTPNLGHVLSVYGVAREVAALTGAPLCAPSFPPVAPTIEDVVPVKVHAADLCGRFSGCVVRGINPKAQTPAWMVDRLARCGQRSVNALVDISNYVMFELGRPSHIFDLAKIEGGLHVRWAQEGEQLELLNGQTVTLQADVGVIADERGVESLAGIMGGQATAVSDDTRDVFIEAAFWWPEAVAGRSRRFNFSTDAGHRFERGVDAEQIEAHVAHITALVLSICGGQAGPVQTQTLALPAREPVSLRVSRAAKVIGMPITQAQVLDVMKRLGLPCEVVSEDVVRVTPPSWRFDLQIEEDLIEEVIRVQGYGTLPGRTPVAPLMARVPSESHRPVHALRRDLAALGYFETINFSFVEAQWERDLAGQDNPIRVLNPIASPMSVMRTSLMGSLLQVLKHNLARRTQRVRVFEIGRTFHRDEQVMAGEGTVRGIRQPVRVGGLAYGPLSPLQWGQRERLVDFFDVKGDLESLLGTRVNLNFAPGTHPALHPGRCAEIRLGDLVIGHLGELHPQWRQSWELPNAPVLFELDLAAVQAASLPSHTPLPRQQSVWRDLALVVGEGVSHASLHASVMGAGEDLVRTCTLFDVYRPKADATDLAAHERSLAVRLELLDDEAPLTDERIDAAVQRVLAHLTTKLSARLR